MNLSRCCILLLTVVPHLCAQDREAYVTNTSNARPLHSDSVHVFGEGVETKIPQIVETDFVFVFRDVLDWPPHYTYIGCFRYSQNGEHVQWFYETKTGGSFTLNDRVPSNDVNAIFAFDPDPDGSRKPRTHYIAAAISKLWFNFVPGSDPSNPLVIDYSAPSVLKFERDRLPRVILGPGFDIYWKGEVESQGLIDPNGPVPVWALPPTASRATPPKGPAPPLPPPPTTCRPAMVVIVKSGTGPQYRVNVSVSVTNAQSAVTKSHLRGLADVGTVARSIQSTATEAGLSAAMVGGDAVRICEAKNAVTVTGAVIDARNEN